MLEFEDALGRLLAGAHAGRRHGDRWRPKPAAGRVLATGLHSPIDVPPLDNTSMDGYALRCADVPASGARLAVAQRIPAGSVGHTLAPGTAARIFTGAPLPAGADAVVMQELCAVDGDALTVNHVPHVGEWIRRRGEDIAAGAEVLAPGTRLTAAHVGVAASVGAARLTVFRRLRVALFSTGDELAMPGEPLKPGGIYNSNRYTLRALLEGLGCVVDDLGIVPDTREATRAALRNAAAGNDLILTSGGVSVGEEDHVKPAVEAEGSLDLWKIAIKPGKPLAFGCGASRSRIPCGGAGDTATSARRGPCGRLHRPAGQSGVELRHLPRCWCGPSSSSPRARPNCGRARAACRRILIARAIRAASSCARGSMKQAGWTCFPTRVPGC
jgi:molybdopterin molybdotransferase